MRYAITAGLAATLVLLLAATATAENPVPDCHESAALWAGKCIPKAKCPGGVAEDGKHCAPIPACEEGKRWVQPKGQCLTIGQECGHGRRWVPHKRRCVVRGLECGHGRTWLPGQERCVVKGAECGPGREWTEHIERCVVPGSRRVNR